MSSRGLIPKTFLLQGTLAALDGYHKRARVVYDDGEEEWLSLPRHAFRWLSPRARTAGCSEPLKRALCALGAQGARQSCLSVTTLGANPNLGKSGTHVCSSTSTPGAAHMHGSWAS